MKHRIVLIPLMSVLCVACDSPDDDDSPSLTEEQQALVDEALDDETLVTIDLDSHLDALRELSEQINAVDADAAGAADALAALEAEVAEVVNVSATLDELRAEEQPASAALDIDCVLGRFNAELAASLAGGAEAAAKANWTQYGGPFSFQCFLKAIMVDHNADIARDLAQVAHVTWSARADAIEALDTTLYWSEQAVYNCAATSVGSNNNHADLAYSASVDAEEAAELARSRFAQCTPWF